MAQAERLIDRNRSRYTGDTFLLITKHGKSAAVAPPFDQMLGAGVQEYRLDTDTLGTFSGEVERRGSALDCARRKCEWGLNQPGGAELCLASEGSFGPHPMVPFLAVDREILYCIDRRNDFHLHVSLSSEKTNYRTGAVDSPDELQEFARAARFPSHSLIVRPNEWNRDTGLLFKGIDCAERLERAFEESCRNSADGAAWVETDMRAHLNPSRMAVIGELAGILAERLQQCCPRCETPGWGIVRAEQGLPCGVCGSRTDLVRSEILGCSRCDHEQARRRSDGQLAADPGQCPRCNP